MDAPMPLPEDALRRLDGLGSLSAKARACYELIWSEGGETPFSHYLAVEQATRDAFHIWAPKLRQDAADCRAERPLPDVQSLALAEREQYRILHAKMEGFEPQGARFQHHHVLVLHSYPVGLLAAQQVFGATSEAVVLLLAAEKARWFNEVYREAEGWFSFHWWTLHDSVPQRHARFIAANYPEPDHFAYWVVSEGRGLGDASHELWKWDGTTAEPIEVFCQVSWEEGCCPEWYE